MNDLVAATLARRIILSLLLWGALVVSWVHNLARPLVISSATRVPFLLVMFGVLGVLAAFGLFGLFLGPVILAVLVAVRRADRRFRWDIHLHLPALLGLGAATLRGPL